jgi:hypothetical protein
MQNPLMVSCNRNAGEAGRICALFLLLLFSLMHPQVIACQAPSGENGNPQSTEEVRIVDAKVGLAKEVLSVIVPGSPLQVKPMTDDLLPLIVRLQDTYPHGDAWRYDFEVIGLEHGEFPLMDYLQREDGSAIDDALPRVVIKVESVLAPGQVLPHELSPLGVRRLGGYRVLMWAAMILWASVLVWMIFFMGRKKQLTVEEQTALTFADYLRPRVAAAQAGSLSSDEYAELERMLTSYWRKRLHMEDREMAESLRALKQHSEAGPLLTALENAMHAPISDKNIAWSELLRPYEQIQFDESASEG